MAHTGSRIGLAVFLLSLACPQGLLGLNTAPPARQFFCNAPQRDAGPDWLVGRGPGSEHGTMLPLGIEGCGYAMIAAPSVRLAQNEAGSATLASRPSACEQAGIYGLEFIGGSVGTAVAAVLPALMIAKSMEGEGPKAAALGLAAFPTCAVSSAFASAAGTYFVGKLFGQRGSFWHALAGGAIGGLGGSIALFSSLSSSGRGALLPVALVVPSICPVIIYNVWRNHGTK
jgi:hypothetical protein